MIGVPVTGGRPSRSSSTSRRCGFTLDHDHTVSDEIRFVQLAPPGSACSIAFGKGVSEMKPGSLDGLQCVVEDADAAHKELAGRGVEVSEVRRAAVGPLRLLQGPRRQRLVAAADRHPRQLDAAAVARDALRAAPRTSAPAPPRQPSRPRPPFSRSSSAFPRRRSLPALPRRTSSPVLPKRRSGPAPPITTSSLRSAADQVRATVDADQVLAVAGADDVVASLG